MSSSHVRTRCCDFVVVTDMDQGCSITNDVENLIECVSKAKGLGQPYRWIEHYLKDAASEEHFDEVKVEVIDEQMVNPEWTWISKQAVEKLIGESLK